MAMVVAHNIPALSTYNVINSTSSALQKSINKLSTGLRINSAADDAAGLAISEKMRAQVRGLDQAVSNSQDGISMIQTAEGALSETHSILQRMRELSVQAANDTLTQQDRGYIQEEVDQLREEITRIGNTTQFNKKKLLNGDAAVLWSSDKNSTKAIVNGGLRTIDQFGQKSSAEGNYKITIKSDAGVGEVQKTDIMKIKHDVNPWYASVDTSKGIAGPENQTAPSIKGGGTYNVIGDVITESDGDQAAAARIVASTGDGTLKASSVDALNNNYSVKFTVSNVDSDNGRITLSYTSTQIGKDGVASEGKSGSITLGNKDVNVALEDDTESSKTLGVSLAGLNSVSKFAEGDEFVMNVNARAVAGEDSIVTVNGNTTTDNASGVAVADHKFTINNKAVAGKSADFKVAYAEPDEADPNKSIIREGDVYLATKKTFADDAADGTWAVFRQGVEVPETTGGEGVEAVTPEWQGVTGSLVKTASAKNFDPSQKITVATQATGTNTGGVMRLGGDSYNEAATAGDNINGLTWSGNTTVTANGIMKLELTDVVKAADSDDGSDHVHAKITFWGTGADGAAYEGATWEGDLKADGLNGTAITLTDDSGQNHTASLGTLTLGKNAFTNGASDANGKATSGFGKDFESGTYYFSSTAHNATAASALKLNVSAKDAAGTEQLTSPIQAYSGTPATADPSLPTPAAGITYSLDGSKFDASKAEEVGLVVLNNTSGLKVVTVDTGEKLMTGLDAIDWEKGSKDFGVINMTLTEAAAGAAAGQNLTVANTLATFDYGTWEKDPAEFDASVNRAESSITGMAAKHSYTVSAQEVGKDTTDATSQTKDLIGDGNVVLVTKSKSTATLTGAAIAGGDVTAATEIQLGATGPINASGYVTIERVNTTAGAADNVRVTFYGTTTDGQVMDGVSELQTWDDTAGKTISRSLTVNGLELGAIKYDGDLLTTAANALGAVGDSITLKIQAGAEEGDIALSMKGTNASSRDAIETGYDPTDINTLNDGATDLPYVILKKGTTVDEVAFYGPAGIADADGNLDAADFNSLGKVTLKSASGTFTSAEATATNPQQLGKFGWTTEAVDAVENPDLTTSKMESSIGQVALGSNSLHDIDKFWDSEGNFLLKDPQTLTLTQGDGKQATVTLYESDTLDSMASKINNAIANELGQAQYLGTGESKDNFATYVDPYDDAPKTSESVNGTMLIRSIVPGSSGDISFSGNEALINALSLNNIQKSKESQYTINIEDAHTGKSVVKDAKITGNKLVGALHPNVDIEFDAMSGIKATWDDEAKNFKLESGEDTTYLHLSDNTTVFQIGANEGEDMGINIGDMRSHALGLDAVNVTNRDSAARSITIIDNAIDKVSTQRAKLGAYQNRLEHTINNLTTASQNLTAAESRIRDTDMAKEMMNFSKLQIMLQAGNSMLAQANQLPQNVLSLVR